MRPANYRFGGASAPPDSDRRARTHRLEGTSRNTYVFKKDGLRCLGVAKLEVNGLLLNLDSLLVSLKLL